MVSASPPLTDGYGVGVFLVSSRWLWGKHQDRLVVGEHVEHNIIVNGILFCVACRHREDPEPLLMASG